MNCNNYQKKKNVLEIISYFNMSSISELRIEKWSSQAKVGQIKIDHNLNLDLAILGGKVSIWHSIYLSKWFLSTRLRSLQCAKSG